MKLVQGTITEIYLEGGTTRARARVGGATMGVQLVLLMDARVGDEILIDSGVAISRVESNPTREGVYVLGNPG